MSPRYLNEDYEWRDCEVLERNGNLIYVEDKESGEADWVSPHELDEENE